MFLAKDITLLLMFNVVDYAVVVEIRSYFTNSKKMDLFTSALNLHDNKNVTQQLK